MSVMASLCQRCKKAQATVHLLDIVPPNGEKRERHLCERCAAEEGLTAHKPESVTNILEGLIKHSSGMAEGTDAQCPNCGITFREFRSHGVLGCPNDYHVFEKHLSPLIERAHDGATHHVGKSPSRLETSEPSSRVKAAKLRRSLKQALDVEDYELAARLRDELQELESA